MPAFRCRKTGTVQTFACAYHFIKGRSLSAKRFRQRTADAKNAGAWRTSPPKDSALMLRLASLTQHGGREKRESMAGRTAVADFVLIIFPTFMGNRGRFSFEVSDGCFRTSLLFIVCDRSTRPCCFHLCRAGLGICAVPTLDSKTEYEHRSGLSDRSGHFALRLR